MGPEQLASLGDLPPLAPITRIASFVITAREQDDFAACGAKEHS
jgi:hypothetical protein